MNTKKSLKAARAASLVLAGCLTAFAAAADSPPPLEGDFKYNFTLLEESVPAPTTAFTDLEGGSRTLADFKGQALVVNFWATWCAPCKREMPSLDRLQTELADEGLKVLAVSIDRAGKKVVAPFLKSLGTDSLEAFLDPKSELAREMAVTGLPATFLVDAEGCLVGGMVGPAEWDSPDALALVRHYLPPQNLGDGEVINTAAAGQAGCTG